MASAAHAHAQDLDDASIDRVARDCGNLAVGCSDAAGHIASVASRVTRQLELLTGLEGAAGQLEDNQRRVTSSTAEARRLAHESKQVLRREAAQMKKAMDGLTELTDLVSMLGGRVADFAETIDQVTRVTDTIAKVARQTNLLALNATIEAARAGEAGRTFAVVAAEVKKLSQESHAANDRIAALMSAFGAKAKVVLAEIREGAHHGIAVQSGVSRMSDTLVEVASAVDRVDTLTAEIEQSTSITNDSVERVRDTLDTFGADARASGEQLVSAEDRLGQLEQLSNDMLNRLAHSGPRISDHRLVDIAMEACADVQRVVERALADGRITTDDVFDVNYQPVADSNPQQFATRFNAFADTHIQPILDRVSRIDEGLIIGTAITDCNGYLPTHMSCKSHPQRPGDPVWNALNSRNRRILLDNQTERALGYEGDFTLYAYRQQLDGDRYRAIKSVYVPLRFDGRRWGNYELAYLD